MTSSISGLPVSVLDSMKCPICLDYATQAMETQCCEQIYCETCIQPLVGKGCPSCCIPNMTVKASKITRRVLGDLPAECPNKCGKEVTRDSLSYHQGKCPQRDYQCPIKDCGFHAIKTEFTKHTSEKHPDCVIAGLELLTSVAEMSDASVQTENEEKVNHCPFDACGQDTMTKTMLRQHIYQSHHKEREWFNQVFHSGKGPIQIINSEGRFGNMACNGKFYCGVEEGSHEPHKSKKNASQRSPCSFDSGLNCWSCMKLDVTLRNLPYGLLVNGAGRVSTPNYCTHYVEDSEYFAENFGRSALCTRRKCKSSPRFGCQLTEPKCSRDIPCKDCQALNFVYQLAIVVKLVDDVEYYKPVWERN